MKDTYFCNILALNWRLCPHIWLLWFQEPSLDATCQDKRTASLLMHSWPQRGYFIDSSYELQKPFVLGSSGFFPALSALAGLYAFFGEKRHAFGWADSSRPSKPTRHPGQISWAQSTIGASCQLVLLTVCHWALLGNEKCYLGIAKLNAKNLYRTFVEMVCSCEDLLLVIPQQVWWQFCLSQGNAYSIWCTGHSKVFANVAPVNSLGKTYKIISSCKRHEAKQQV